MLKEIAEGKFRRTRPGHLVCAFGVSQRHAFRGLGTSRSSLSRGESAATRWADEALRVRLRNRACAQPRFYHRPYAAYVGDTGALVSAEMVRHSSTAKPATPRR